MDVSVDQAGSDVRAIQVDFLLARVFPDSRDTIADDRDVAGFDFAAEDIDDAAVSQHQVRWRIPTGDG